MANINALKNRIRSNVKSNDNQEITGHVMQDTLLDMANELDPSIEEQRAMQAEAALNRGLEAVTTEVNKKPDTVDISNYISEGDELPLGCYYVYYGNPTHTLAGRYTYTDTYFIAICISHWEHAHTLAIYTKNAQNKYIYYETFRTDQASTAMERYIASLFAGAPATYQQDGLMSASDKQAFDKLQESISEETTQSEEEAIRFETDGGTLVGKVDSTGADFINLKRNGYQVATVAQIPGIDTSIGDSPSQIKVPTTKAVKDYVDAHQIDLPITEETTQSETEEMEFGGNAGSQTYAAVGSYGVKSKAYLDMSGNSVIPTRDTSIGEIPSQTNVPTSKAVADYVVEHGGGVGDLPITKEIAFTDEEEITVSNEAKTEAYVFVGNYGIKAKKYLDMQGNELANVITRHIVCRRNGTEGVDCDFSGLNAIHKALRSIIDNSYYKRYVIHVVGHFIFKQVCFEDNNEDVTAEYWDSVSGATVRSSWQGGSNEWLANVYGKDYVTIDGGSKEETSIEVYLDGTTQFPLYPDESEHYTGANFHVLFVANHWAEFKNITFVGYNTRYLVHTEQADESSYNDSYVLFEDCRFVYKKDYTWKRDDNTTTGVVNSANLFGLGLRTNYDWHINKCEFYHDNEINTIGGHSGYLNDYNRLTVRHGGRISIKECSFFGSKSIAGFTSYYPLIDVVCFEECEFPSGSVLSSSISYQYSQANRIRPCKIIVDGGHVKYIQPPTNNVLAINYIGTTTKVRVSQACSAFGLFSYLNNAEEQLVDLQRNSDGARVFNGYSAKDGEGGYLLGEKNISMDKNNEITLATILGDCSSTYKTLDLYINDVLVSKNLTSDYSSMTDEDIIAELNSLYQSNDIEFALFDSSLQENLICKNSELCTNASGVTVYKGAGIVFLANRTFRLATNGEEVDGICLSYKTPNNEVALISKGGEYGSILGASYNNGKFYAIGNTAGSFVQTDTPTRIKAINNIYRLK